MIRSILILLLAVSLGNQGQCSTLNVQLPKETAAHFCRLLVNDGEGRVSTISSYIRTHQATASDSLTLEQLFTNYVFQYEGWKTLRIFPHSTKDQVRWYAATDALPDDLDPEHQKYICEIFGRLSTEVEAGHWEAVNACINRMEQYQCRFGGVSRADTSRQPVTWIVGSLFLLFLLFPALTIVKAKL